MLIDILINERSINAITLYYRLILNDCQVLLFLNFNIIC